jgi:beta-lactamase regulating signal transducer with metallopeptidase domain
MIFGQRWVPMEVMNTIFVLWAVAVVIVVVLLLLLRHVERSKKASKSATHATSTGKRSRSKKH